MEKNQTAVEWLLLQLRNRQFSYMDLSFEICIPTEVIDKAIEMERDQIIEAHDAAYIAMNLAFRGFDRSVEYYEKTYGA